MIVSKLLPRHVEDPAPAHHYIVENGRGESLRGFGVRCHPSGRKTYVLRYAGRQIRIGDPDLITIEEARSRARRRKIEIAEAPVPPEWLAKRTSLREFFVERFEPFLIARQQSRGLKEVSLNGYRRYWDQEILPRFGRLKLDKITADLLAQWKTADSRRPVAFNRGLQQLYYCLRYAVKLGWLAANPAKEVERYGEHPSDRVFSDEEIRAWAGALRKLEAEGGVSAGQAALLWTLFYTGARPGEVLKARREWIRLGEGGVGHLVLPEAKGDRPGRPRGRTIRIPPVALEKLLALRRLPHAGPRLVPGVQTLRKPFQRVCEAAGIEKASPKVLRHVWRSVGPEAGVEKEQLRQLGGWSDHKTPDAVYAHERGALDEAARKIAERLEELTG